MTLRTLTTCFLSLCAVAGAQAQNAEPAPAPPAEPGIALKRSLELSAGGQSLSDGYGRWGDVTLRGTVAGGAHVLQGELSAHERFGARGAYVAVGDTYTFNPDWYGSLALGLGDGAFYLPRYRVDATLYRKWLADRSLVSSIGAGYYDAPDGHTDRSLALGLIYYFDAPWVVEGGVRFNSSDPGAIRTRQHYLAATWGRDKQDLVSARYGWGGEGYLSIAANTQLVNFDSREASLSWRHWLGPRGGFLLGVSRYSNPSYQRSGINAGVFGDF